MFAADTDSGAPQIVTDIDLNNDAGRDSVRRNKHLQLIEIRHEASTKGIIREGARVRGTSRDRWTP